MERIKKLMKLGYSIEFAESTDLSHYIFVTLNPLYGYNTKLDDSKDFKGFALEEALDSAIKHVE